jgi:hypothetical protein
MDLDRVLHEKKNFAELVDADIEAFLRDRTFGSEHLNLEFKNAFPRRGRSRWDIGKICKYIVGFSNEEGGLVVYGVADSIKDPATQYPEYVSGLQDYPNPEDLSQWVKDRIHPLVQSPAIRFFNLEQGTVAIIKIPSGVNKPYCYYDPNTKSLTFFKKTAAGIVQLSPDEVREFYRTAMLDQAARLLRGLSKVEIREIEGNEDTGKSRLDQHKEFVLSKLENVDDFGHLSIYCLPDRSVDVPIEELSDFLEANRFGFSEAIRFFPDVEVFQNGVSVGYFPRAIRSDIRSTVRVTLYRDGLVAFDSQADSTMDRDKHLHPYWLSYEIQRHLQLAKAVLKDRGVERIRVVVDLGNIGDFSMKFSSDRFFFEQAASEYTGSHQPIDRDVSLAEIHDYDGDKRNIVMPIVQEIMDEICRIFGFSKTLPGVWDEEGKLIYVKGLENQR